MSEDAGRPCTVEWSAESLVRPNDQTTHRCRGNMYHDGDHWCGCGRSVERQEVDGGPNR